MSVTEFRYTFSQLAKLFGVSKSSIWRWHLHGVKGKKLGSVLIGGRRYTLQSQLDAFCGDTDRKRNVDADGKKIAQEKLNARGV